MVRSPWPHAEWSFRGHNIMLYKHERSLAAQRGDLSKIKLLTWLINREAKRASQGA